jgi:aryl-alcohol dehydrogenase-like predicted oxidoreductase
MQFRWTVSEAEAFRILDAYFDAGHRVIDTADVYTNWAPGCDGGEAETIIGHWLKRRGCRDDNHHHWKGLAAACGLGPDGEGLSRQHILRACHDSLRRLHTDYLDVYLATDSPSLTPLVAAFGTSWQSCTSKNQYPPVALCGSE